MKFIKTDNIPLVDTLIYNVKKLCIESVLKDEDEADKEETLESSKAWDLYRKCVERRVKFSSLRYDIIDLEPILPPNILEDCVKNNNLIPEKFRDIILNNKMDRIVKSYVEQNNYYRQLNGLPRNEISPLFVPEYLIPPGIHVDISVPIHEMNYGDIDILYNLGVIDKIQELNPEDTYLQRLGNRGISPYNARIANNFSILYTPNDVPREILDRFKERVEINRVYTIKVIYSDAFKLGSDHYDKFMIILILIQCMVDMLSEINDMIIKRDLIDLKMIKIFFESHGVDFFGDIPYKYQIRMVKNIDTLIKYKSTTKNIVDICNLFGFDNIHVFKYYLLKDRKTDENGEYVFEYDSDGNLQDDDNYEMKFIKVPIADRLDNHIGDKSKYTSYDEMVMNDKYWDGDLPSKLVKSAIINKEFNSVQSKYISIDTVYELTEVAFQLVYFYNMVFDDVRTEEMLKLKIDSINSNVEFRFIDVIVYLFILMYEYNGIVDDIMDNNVKVMHVKGFNFRADMNKLSSYVVEKGFTLEELGVSDFIVPENNILTYNQLMDIFTNNKKVYNHVVDQLYSADNKDIYEIYNTIYESLMLTELNFEFFRKSDGKIATSYTEYLRDRDNVLYQSVQYLRSIESKETRNEKITYIINDIVYLLEYYLTSDNMKHVFAHLPTVSAEYVKQYVYKVINFFKSYKVDISGINTVYLFDDKLDNKIKMIDKIIFEYSYIKTDVIDLLERLRRTTLLNPEDTVKIIEQVEFSITYWVDKFYNTIVPTTESITSIDVSMLKMDCSHVEDTFNSIKSKFYKSECLSSMEKYDLISNGVRSEIISMVENMDIDITYWSELLSRDDISCYDKINLNSVMDKNEYADITDRAGLLSTVLKRENKYELYSNTKVSSSLYKRDGIGINDSITITQS